ncbi:hypothetical protein ZTR_03698 [Talaromyces verruculosus]|nr:hypothetical protein ZTR_03698 [Talaromyces verruculosus]
MAICVNDPKLLRKFISACHILHYHSVLDAYGHISLRNPTNPNVFIMCRNMAPANVSSVGDLVEYHVADASPVTTSAPTGYVERYIHSEIYKKYPKVNSVIHSHSDAVIPYCNSSMGTPKFEISDYWKSDDIKDLLVRNVPLGEALASQFSGSNSDQSQPSHSVVLMRGHGMTVVANNIEECVLKAIYTQKNAAIQTATLTLVATLPGSSNGESAIRYLDDEEAKDAENMSKWSCHRPWDLWVREVEESKFYVNQA